MIKKFKENTLLVSEYRGNLKGKRETKKKERETPDLNSIVTEIKHSQMSTTTKWRWQGKSQ